MDFLVEHRKWLKDYEGLHYSIGEDGHHKKGHEWTKTKYKDAFWSPEINMVGERKDRLKIEFDGNETDAKKYLEQTRNFLVEKKWGFIRTTHHGKCDYLWIEFTRNLTDKEKESFLMWIAPDGSEIDLNFASSKKVFPVMYAVHWKHSYHRETPIEIFNGEKIDFDTLNIKTQSKLKKTVTNSKGYEYVRSDGYKTFKAGRLFTRIGQAEKFIETQPVYYDSAKIWWIWDQIEKYWKIVDETDILNKIMDEMEIDVVNSKAKNEILTSLELVGRKNKPISAKNTWIQFKNKIIDYKTKEVFDAKPEYLITNPLPWEISEENHTPTIDKILTSWVGEKYVNTLYEIIAYCLISDYPIHRIFCFIGSGLNGKSKFLELLRKFIGNKNCCSTELDTLLTSRFEVTRLYKKLVCQMGETNFNEMNKTSMLKKLSGGDLIGFEYKRKTPFEDKNYAKILISTNNLPTTSDKTIGFYRRWLIIDFPNQFTEKKDILEDIPEEEFKNLGKKCVDILKNLLKKREFTNEGNIEERTRRFEEKSNPFIKFWQENITEEVNSIISKKKFYEKISQWCKENNFRTLSEVSIAKHMKEKDIESSKLTMDWIHTNYNETKPRYWAWMGIKFKTDERRD